MAITSIEGLLEIDLADVFGWLSSECGVTEVVKALRFSVDEDALVIEMGDDKAPAFVDSLDLWKWLIEVHLPAGINHYETVFGVPTVDDSNQVLSITFAASNACDPRSWVKPPACLAEWKRLTTA